MSLVSLRNNIKTKNTHFKMSSTATVICSLRVKFKMKNTENSLRFPLQNWLLHFVCLVKEGVNSGLIIIISVQFFRTFTIGMNFIFADFIDA